MGCCCSGEEHAAESDVPPPKWGQPLKVKLQKQGMLDADFNVIDMTKPPDPGEERKPWMLMDMVGGLFDADWTFYLKHRSAGQVDAEGKAESSTLGAATLVYPELRYRVIPSAHADPFFHNAKGHGESYITVDFELSRRCLLYADREMTRCVGRLEIAATGVYKKKKYITKKDGKKHTHVADTHVTQRIHYKVNVYNSDMVIKFIDHSPPDADNIFTARSLEWSVWNNVGAELCRIKSDGDNFADVTTMEGVDPVNTLLAAFAIGVQMDPPQINEMCERECNKEVQLDERDSIGHAEAHGTSQEQFELHYEIARQARRVEVDLAAAGVAVAQRWVVEMLRLGADTRRL